MTIRFILGFLIGFMVGASIALAFAPQPALASRQELWEKVRERAQRGEGET